MVVPTMISVVVWQQLACRIAAPGRVMMRHLQSWFPPTGVCVTSGCNQLQVLLVLQVLLCASWCCRAVSAAVRVADTDSALAGEAVVRMARVFLCGALGVHD